MLVVIGTMYEIPAAPKTIRSVTPLPARTPQELERIQAENRNARSDADLLVSLVDRPQRLAEQ